MLRALLALSVGCTYIAAPPSFETVDSGSMDGGVPTELDGLDVVAEVLPGAAAGLDVQVLPRMSALRVSVVVHDPSSLLADGVLNLAGTLDDVAYEHEVPLVDVQEPVVVDIPRPLGWACEGSAVELVVWVRTARGPRGVTLATSTVSGHVEQDGLNIDPLVAPAMFCGVSVGGLDTDYVTGQLDAHDSPGTVELDWDGPDDVGHVLEVGCLDPVHAYGGAVSNRPRHVDVSVVPCRRLQIRVDGQSVSDVTDRRYWLLVR
ncbi:MAG: hypothetical protein KTR31_35995 [Myxococcales bacterium]|nr:hypothetical protein [Myxococcales bacterium]